MKESQSESADRKHRLSREFLIKKIDRQPNMLSLVPYSPACNWVAFCDRSGENRTHLSFQCFSIHVPGYPWCMAKGLVSFLSQSCLYPIARRMPMSLYSQCRSLYASPLAFLFRLPSRTVLHILSFWLLMRSLALLPFSPLSMEFMARHFFTPTFLSLRRAMLFWCDAIEIMCSGVMSLFSTREDEWMRRSLTFHWSRLEQGFFAFSFQMYKWAFKLLACGMWQRPHLTTITCEWHKWGLALYLNTVCIYRYKTVLLMLKFMQT